MSDPICALRGALDVLDVLDALDALDGKEGGAGPCTSNLASLVTVYYCR